MNKIGILVATLALFAASANAEIRSVELTIFGMD
jgi:hypothetical protein